MLANNIQNPTDGETGRENVLQNAGHQNGHVNNEYSENFAAKLKRAQSIVAEMSKTTPIDRNDRKVLVLYTGGTIGMVKNLRGALEPQRGVFENLIRTYPQLHDNAVYRQKLREPGFNTSYLVLPETKESENMVIIYKILEYENLLDSSNLTDKEWMMIANDIMKNYESYDGFVVLHGTDTLCYTASALSFMFENIGKAIVLTGSQIPIFETRNDGIDNFVSSLIIAGAMNIPEVTIFFANKLLRGNRTRKLSATSFTAFDSPNFEPLVKVGIEFEVNRKAIFKPTVIAKCRLHAKLTKNVGLLRIFPSISSAVFEAFCQPPIEGVVLESYGAGNIPSNREDINDVIEKAVKRGVIFVNITQCSTGAVSGLYEAGRQLEDVGVVAGNDMTPEAALTKLAYVLSKDELSYEEKKEMMSMNIRGELTSMSYEPKLNLENTLVDCLAQCLNIQVTKKLEDKVFSALMMYAIENGDVAAVNKMLDMGADVNVQNSEGRTPLHEAVMRGNLEMVEYLLMNGANVHLKTRSGEPPLLTAIHRDDSQMIDLINKCGGHLASVDLKTLCEIMSLASRSGSTTKLESLRMAGADFNLPDEMKQTPFHKAVICNSVEAVKYLLRHGAEKNATDILGYTPLDYAKQLKHSHIQEMLSKL